MAGRIEMDGPIATEPSDEGSIDALLRPKTWQGRKVFTAVLLSMAVVVGVVTLCSSPHPQPTTMKPRSVAQKDALQTSTVYQTFLVGGVDFYSFALNDDLLRRFKSALYEKVASIVDTDYYPEVYPGVQAGSVIVSWRVKVGITSDQIAQSKQCLLGLEVKAETEITEGVSGMEAVDKATFTVGLGGISTQFCAVADDERDAWRRCDELQQGVVRTIPQSVLTTLSCKSSPVIQFPRPIVATSNIDSVFQTFVVEGVDFNSFALDNDLLGRFKSALSEKMASIVDTDTPPEVYPGYRAGSVIVTFLVKVGSAPVQIAQYKQCLVGLEVKAETEINEAVSGLKAVDKATFTVGPISTQFCAVADVERDAWRRCDQLQQGVLKTIPSLVATLTCKAPVHV